MTFLAGELHHNFKHGQSRKKETTGAYKSWLAMVNRCNPANAEKRPDYAGAGIEVCERWVSSFENFYADMGDRPKGGSIDRIDPEKGYEISNCRWASNREQAMNRRSTIFTEVNGETLCLFDISKAYGIPMTTISRRYKQGVRGDALISKVNRNSLRVGSMVGSSKISESIAVDIKKSLLSGEKDDEVAERFGVSKSLVGAIRRGETWAHVSDGLHYVCHCGNAGHCACGSA